MNSLSLCVICKNEENSIGQLLDSVKGNLFDEIIVVDTGSTDRTLEILKQHKVKIDNFKWVNDFSAARNYAFSKAKSDYIMWLDSDDYIKPADYQKLLDLKSRLQEFPIWLIKYEYAHDEYGNSICSFFRERIVKREANLKWEQPIHEYIPLLLPYQKVDIEVHHNKKDVHTSRNVTILEDIVKKNPTFSRNVYYLGKEYFDSGDTDKGIPLLEKYLDMPDTWSENLYGALIRLSEHQITLKNNDKAREYLFKSIRVDPLKAKSYYYLGDLSLGESNFSAAIHWFSICKNMARSEDSLDVVEPKYSTWLPNLQLCLAYNFTGNIVAAAESNEEALSYRPEDSRMLANKSIFIKSLVTKYPFRNGETLESYNNKLKPIPIFKGKIGWYTPTAKDFASTRIRMLNMNETLRSLGCDSEIFNPSNEKQYDFIVTGKVFDNHHLLQIKLWKMEGISVICDINENILEFNYVREIIKECDSIICCSHEFKEILSREFSDKPIAVIEDAVEYFSGGLNDY